VRQLLAKHIATAAAACPPLNNKPVTPHTLRHTNAMLLRAAGIDITTIALWLGHESIKTTYIYQHADPALKEQAIARLAPFGAKPGRYRPSDALLAFLPGRPGALLRPAPLRTGHAPFNASGSSKP
jgi:hypothetical protein